MNLPDIWGQGALFTYSGLEGECDYQKCLLGYLSGDNVGIRFSLPNMRELYLDTHAIDKITYLCVTSDYIEMDLSIGNDCTTQKACFVFAAQNLVVGYTSAYAIPYVITMGEFEQYAENGIDYQQTSGCVTALYKKSTAGRVYFAFSLGGNREEVTEAVKKLDNYDFPAARQKKIAFYEQCSQIDAPASVQRMLGKCFSVMKSQFYTRGSAPRKLWTSPDKLPHRAQWLWDSVFHSVGNKYLSPEIGIATLEAVLDTQCKDGFIPHRTDFCEAPSDITQPPVLAWGIYQLCSYQKDFTFAKKSYEKLCRYLTWNQKNRGSKGGNLFSWHIDTQSYHCRCDECGMDNSPRFDNVSDMKAIDFSCFMANEARYMAYIAKELHMPEEAERWMTYFQKVQKDIEEELWNEEEQFYFDLKDDGTHKKVWSIASFLPLFAGVCSKERAEILVSYLKDEEKFATPFAIPSIARFDKTFGTDMWRGPVWINYNYMIAEGLDAYGYHELAEQITDKTIETLIFWYEKDGIVYEFYDSLNQVSPSKLNRKGKVLEPYNFSILYQSIRDYGWSSTLLAAMIMKKYAHK